MWLKILDNLHKSQQIWDFKYFDISQKLIVHSHYHLFWENKFWIFNSLSLSDNI